jgi:rare lipoprotein A
MTCTAILTTYVRRISTLSLVLLLTACASSSQGYRAKKPYRRPPHPIEVTPPVPAPAPSIETIPAPVESNATLIDPTKKSTITSPSSVNTSSFKRSGGFYLDDGPQDVIPVDLASVPDATPKIEPYHKFANRPYVVFGRDYLPMLHDEPVQQRGFGSWYGRKFHGQKTSMGEIYDMFAMTAAHPTLPLPSYVRVTNVDNGKTIVVRVNDRGPFLHERIIDLSYVAAWKLDYVNKGTGNLLIERITPQEIQANRQSSGITNSASASTTTATPTNTATLNTAVSTPSMPIAVPITSTAAPTTTATSAPTAPPSLLTTTLNRGVYLQLGAFSGAETAQNFRTKIERLLDWMPASLHLVSKGNLIALQAGPFKDRQHALESQSRIYKEASVQPFVVER